MHEVFEHTADLGIRVRAASLPELFADAARGLFSVVTANLEAVRPVEEERCRIAAAGPRHDDLLFDWLAELLYRFDVRHMLFSVFEVEIDEEGVSAVLRGEPIDRERHAMEREVKAITYHGLKVEREGEGWLAEVIVDI